MWNLKSAIRVFVFLTLSASGYAETIRLTAAAVTAVDDGGTPTGPAYWTTWGNYKLYLERSNGTWVNPGSGSEIDIPLTVGDHTFRIFGKKDGDYQRQALALYFNGHGGGGSTHHLCNGAADIMVSAPIATSTISNPMTVGFSNACLGTARKVFIHDDMIVLLTDFRWQEANVERVDRVGNIDSQPDGMNDYVGTFTLRVMNARRILYTGSQPLDTTRLASIGAGTVVKSFGNTNAEWASALTGGLGAFDAIVVGEGTDPFALNETTRSNIKQHVFDRGGKVIVTGARGLPNNGDSAFLNAVFGYNTFIFAGCLSGQFQAGRLQSAAAANTSFAGGPPILDNGICTTHLVPPSLPAGATIMYGDPNAVVFMAKSGLGVVGFLGWNFSPNQLETTADNWYRVLNNAVNYTSAAAVFTTTTVTPDPMPSVFGQGVRFSAMVASDSTTVTAGSVTFKEGSVVLAGPMPLDNSGGASFSTNTLSTGSHTIVATYTGAANFLDSTGSVTHTVDKANTAVTLHGNLNPSRFGDAATFAATVTSAGPGAGTPTGVVTFTDGGIPLTGGTVSLGAGMGFAIFTTSTLSGGTHNIKATYNGDSNFNSNSGSLSQIVNPASTTTTVLSFPNPSVARQDVTLTATVRNSSGAVTTGTVTLEEGGNALADPVEVSSAGIATFSTNNLLPGMHTITATYTGNSDFAPSSGTASHVVNRADPLVVLTSDANPTVYGRDVTLDVRVQAVGRKDVPVGDVVLKQNGVTVAGPTELAKGGVASFTLSNLTVGTYAITVDYLGDEDFNPATASIDQIVEPRPAEVLVRSVNKMYGTDDPVLTGDLVGFLDSDNVTATYSRGQGEAANTYPIEVRLSAGAGVLNNYSVLIHEAVFTIQKAAASVTPNDASKPYGRPDPILTGTLAGFIPGDGVTATFTRAAGTNVGTYAIGAALAPAAVLDNYEITYHTGNFYITPAEAFVFINPISKTFGEPDPALTGSLLGFLAADNVTATYTRAAGEAPGQYQISADLHAANASVLVNYNVSVRPADLTIHKYRFSLNSSTGAQLTITPTAASGSTATATVTLAPATVGGKDALVSPGTDSNNQPLPPSFKVWLAPVNDRAHPILFGTGIATKVALEAGAGNFAWQTSITAPLDSLSFPPGDYVAFVYGDDGSSFTNNAVPNDAGYVAADTTHFFYPTLMAPIRITQGGTTTSISAPTVTYAASGVVTVTVSSAAGTPTGNVSITVDGTPMSAPLSNGSAVFTINNLTAGGHDITASYAAQNGFGASSSTGTLQVDPRSITVTADPKSKTFGEADPPLTYQVTHGSLVAGDSFTGTLNRSAGENVGSYVIQRGSLAANANYSLAFIGASFTINRAPTSTSVLSSSSPSAEGQAVTFTATVQIVPPGTGTPGGHVEFLDGANLLGRVSLLNGTAALTTTFKDGPGGRAITARYADDSNNVAPSTASLTQSVNNVAPAITGVTGYAHAYRGVATTVNAAFTDAGVLDTHTCSITWGDGQTGAGSVSENGGAGSCTAAHTYAQAGTYAASVVVADNNNGAVTSNFSVIVNQPPAVSGLTVVLNPSKEGSPVTLQGTFTDADASAAHIVTINWGDGSANTTVDLASGLSNFSANHTYLDNGPKPPTSASYTYPIQVSVANNFGASGTGSRTVTITNANPVITGMTGPATVNKNTSATFTANFTDPGVLDKHTCTFTFGNGHLLPGVVTESGGTGSCTATYTYRSTGTFNVGVTVFDDNQGYASSFVKIVVK